MTRTIAGGALVNLCLGSLYAWSLLVEPLHRALDIPQAALSSVFSVAVVTFAATVLVAGAMVDRISPRRVVTVAAVATTAGLLIAARASSLAWIIAGYGLLFGVGNGLGYSTAVAAGGRAFERRRGLALGMIIGAYAAGPLAASPVITMLLASTGWRATFVALAVGIGVLLVIGALLLGGPVSGQASAAAGASRGRALLLQPRGALLWLAFLSGTLPALLVTAHAATIAGARGLSRAAVSVAVATLGGGNLIGRTTGGWLSDRIGRIPGLRVATATLAGACLALAAVTGAWAVLAAVAVIGVAYGVQATLVPAATADAFGTANFGANFGRVFTGWGVAGLVGPQIGSWLQRSSQGFDAALSVGAASALLAFGIYIGITRVGRATAGT